LAIISIPAIKKQLEQGCQGIEGTGRLSGQYPITIELAMLLSSFNLWCCICVGKSCQMIKRQVISTTLHTCMQNILGHNC